MRTRGTGRDTGRVEAFSDGVFAIAITLLILEIKIPHAQGPSRPIDLRDGLLDLWPSYFAYVLSFVTIGIYWARHHYIFLLYEKTDHAFKLLNLVFLLSISFLRSDRGSRHVYARSAEPDASHRLLCHRPRPPAAPWIQVGTYARRPRRCRTRSSPRRFQTRASSMRGANASLLASALLASAENPRFHGRGVVV